MLNTNKKDGAAKQPKGFLGIILHAHLPFVRHPESDYFLEENWFYEAVTETYIPLLEVFENLTEDCVPFKITLSLSPTLCSMLADPLLQQRCLRHINKLIELSQKEIVRTKNNPEFHSTAQMYLEQFLLVKHIYLERYGCNILPAFKKLAQAGMIELITSTGTHGYLPIMQYNINAVKAQISIGIETFEEFFGVSPCGIWLPECGYYPGVEKILEQWKIRYILLDSHGILFAHPRPKYGLFAPVYCSGSTVAAFGRDIESSKAVWSSIEGYPGDFNYRDFYRDIGFDLDMNYIAPYIDPIGIRTNTGIKYYKITGKTNNKLPYNRSAALKKAFEHAGNFMFNREKQVEYLCSIMDRTPIIISPYDAELFGHWWYEGPEWLNYLIRKIAFEQHTISLITPSQYLDLFAINQECTPSYSSWGYKGYSEVWLDESNNWIYRHIQRMEDKMVECAHKYPKTQGIKRRVLNQMARELLLAQSSDWAFIIKMGTMVQYAVRRIKEHISNFLKLYEELEKNNINENFLSLLESRNNIFPKIDYRIYA